MVIVACDKNMDTKWLNMCYDTAKINQKIKQYMQILQEFFTRNIKIIPNNTLQSLLK